MCRGLRYYYIYIYIKFDIIIIELLFVEVLFSMRWSIKYGVYPFEKSISFLFIYIYSFDL